MVTAVAVLGAALLPVLLTAAFAVDIQRALSFGDAGLGVAISAFWAASMVASAPAGRLADTFGGGRGVRLGAGLGAGAAFAIAGLAHTYWVLVTGLVVAGTGLAFAAPGMSAAVSRQTTPARRGSVLGVQQSGPAVATLVAGLALPTIGDTVGWRWAFVAAGGATLLAAASVRTADCSTATRDRRPALASVDVLVVAGVLAGAVASAAVAFVVPLAEAAGFSENQAGVLLAVAGAVTVAVRIGLGFGADAGRVDPGIGMAVTAAVGAIGLVALASSSRVVLAAGVVLGIGVGWGWGGLYVLSAIERNPTAPGAAVGSAMRGVYLGAILGPLAGGPVAAALPEALWLSAAALAAVAAGLFALGRRAASPP